MLSSLIVFHKARRTQMLLTISKCSSIVFFVKGLVGFVELGNTLLSFTTFIISGASEKDGARVRW